MDTGDDEALTAFAVYTYRLRAAIATMVAALSGVDAVSFTGGVGENSPTARAGGLAGLEYLGVAVNPGQNEAARGDGNMSTAGSPAAVPSSPPGRTWRSPPRSTTCSPDRSGYKIRTRWAQQIAAGLVAVCPVVELELSYTARSKADRDELVELLHTAFGWVSMPVRVFDRAAEIQVALTERGAHRSAGAVDLLVAATAESHGLVLLHYDRDFEQVGAVTGQPTQWLAASGSLS